MHLDRNIIMQTQYSPTKFYGVWTSYRFVFCISFFNLANALPLLLFDFLPKKSSILVTFPQPFSFYAYYRHLQIWPENLNWTNGQAKSAAIVNKWTFAKDDQTSKDVCTRCSEHCKSKKTIIVVTWIKQYRHLEVICFINWPAVSHKQLCIKYLRKKGK